MRKLVAEFLGTALLLAAVVGSGIMGERLAQGNVALALLANTLAAGATLAALILTFGPISGSHLNPVVTLADAALGGLPWKQVPGYVVAQLSGALIGVLTALQCSPYPCTPFPITLAPASPNPSVIHSYLRSARRDLGLRPLPAVCRPLCSRRVHHRRILVHSVHFIRQSSRNNRPFVDGHIRRHPPLDATFIAAQLLGTASATFCSAGSRQNWSRLMPDKKSVLILCTGNSARSQMAEGLFRHLGGDRFEVFSAGTRPSNLRPEAIIAMREIGIDISQHRSKSVDEFVGRPFDYIITVCETLKRPALFSLVPVNVFTGPLKTHRLSNQAKKSLFPSFAK